MSIGLHSVLCRGQLFLYCIVLRSIVSVLITCGAEIICWCVGFRSLKRRVQLLLWWTTIFVAQTQTVSLLVFVHYDPEANRFCVGLRSRHISYRFCVDFFHHGSDVIPCPQVTTANCFRAGLRSLRRRGPAVVDTLEVVGDALTATQGPHLTLLVRHGPAVLSTLLVQLVTQLLTQRHQLRGHEWPGRGGGGWRW